MTVTAWDIAVEILLLNGAADTASDARTRLATYFKVAGVVNPSDNAIEDAAWDIVGAHEDRVRDSFIWHNA